ncbi:MAG: flagellar basal-body MS-ring/collar protein FliF [Peptostreptococcales bacterium]
MQNLGEFWGRIKNVWANMPNKKKVALIIVSACLLAMIMAYYFFFGRTTYDILFADLSVADSGAIITKLDELDVTYKLENRGATIKVPTKQVDKLRISLANEGALSSAGAGFELFDNSGFALTNEEREIMYQRALQGELQRAIMSMDEVDYASVILSMPKESLFSEERKKGSASIVLKIKQYKRLSPEKVRGIVALVSGAVRDIAPEHIEVIDTDMNYLSSGLNHVDNPYSIKEANDRMSLKKDFEKTLEEDIKLMLETAFGKDKIVVKINADMNFDTKETTSIAYDHDNPVIVSIQESISITDGADAGFSLSPVDNNIQYYGANTDEVAAIPGLGNYENIRNYEIGETTTKIVKAPGVVDRMTTSVIYDGQLSDTKKEAIRNIVVAAVGLNEVRGDIISVEGFSFDRSSEQELRKSMEEAEQKYFADMRRRELIRYIALGLVLLLILISILILARKRKHSQLALNDTKSLKPAAIQPVAIEEMLNDISLKHHDEQSEVEEEINKYAKESPHKVAEVIKTWLLQEEA